MSDRSEVDHPGERAGDRDPAQKPVTVEQLQEELRKLKLQTWIAYGLVALFFAAGGGYVLHESAVREDGQCRIFEKDEEQAVQQLETTYLFMTGRDEDAELYDVALEGLPRAEAEAVSENAPGYCNDEGVGLPEPDPTIPERPPLLDKRHPELPPQPGVEASRGEPSSP